MSVMNRKLFMNRDAREKLRGMGGIMASSPELAQTVAMFNNGGGVTIPVAPPAPSIRDRTREAARILLDNGMSIADVQALIEQGVDLNAMLAQLPPGTVPSIDAERPADIFPPSQAEEEMIRQSVGMTTGTPLFEQAVEPLPPGAAPPVAETTVPETVEEVPPEVEQMLEEATDAGTSVDADQLETLRTDYEALLAENQRLQEGAEDPSTDDLEALAERRVALYRRLFGEDEPTPRNRDMQLAMIGLAIAAGQSPDALTNIASGALAGLQAIRQQEAADEERERALRGSAIESVLTEQRETRQDLRQEQEQRLQEYREGRRAIVEAALGRAVNQGITDPTEAYQYAQTVADAWARSEYPDLVRAPSTTAAPATVPTTGTPQRARNPQTGEVLILRDGQWVPE